MNSIVTVAEVKALVDQNIISYDQAALVFGGITVSGVYQKFYRLKHGKLARTELNEQERRRLADFTQNFDDFINLLKKRLGENNE